MSAITTMAPFMANSFAVSSPIPLAAPVIRATLPSNLNHVRFIRVYNIFLGLDHQFNILVELVS